LSPVVLSEHLIFSPNQENGFVGLAVRFVADPEASLA
jgi:hypothetical protein